MYYSIRHAEGNCVAVDGSCLFWCSFAILELKTLGLNDDCFKCFNVVMFE